MNFNSTHKKPNQTVIEQKPITQNTQLFNSNTTISLLPQKAINFIEQKSTLSMKNGPTHLIKTADNNAKQIQSTTNLNHFHKHPSVLGDEGSATTPIACSSSQSLGPSLNFTYPTIPLLSSPPILSLSSGTTSPPSSSKYVISRIAGGTDNPPTTPP